MSAELYIKKPVQTVGQAALGLERHYSVGEIAERWGLSEKTVRRMFENEEGVLQWGSPETRRKRGYITLRIPNSLIKTNLDETAQYIAEFLKDSKDQLSWV